VTATTPEDPTPHPDEASGYASVDRGECIDVAALRRVLNASAPDVLLRLVTDLATGDDEPIGDVIISGERSSAAVELRIATSPAQQLRVGQLARRIIDVAPAALVKVRPAADRAISVAVVAVLAHTQPFQEPAEEPAVYLYIEPIN
jgi:hypothetical protein